MHSSITGTNIGQRLKSKYPLITCSLLIFNLICHLFVKQVGEGGGGAIVLIFYLSVIQSQLEFSDYFVMVENVIAENVLKR